MEKNNTKDRKKNNNKLSIVVGGHDLYHKYGTSFKEQLFYRQLFTKTFLGLDQGCTRLQSSSSFQESSTHNSDNDLSGRIK